MCRVELAPRKRWNHTPSCDPWLLAAETRPLPATLGPGRAGNHLRAGCQALLSRYPHQATRLAKRASFCHQQAHY